jgi:hypothetical protein
MLRIQVLCIYRLCATFFTDYVHFIMYISKIYTYLHTHVYKNPLYLSKSKIRLQLPHILLPKLLLRVRSAHARRHNHILALLPINRRHNALLVARLQTINHAQHFGRVPACRRRVHHGQADLLGRVDDEDRANGEGDAAFFGEAVDVLLRDHVRDPFGVGGEVVGGLVVELVMGS